MYGETRTKLEAEIGRGLDRMKQLSPESEEYQKISSKIIQMTELVNKDDDSAGRFEIDKDRLKADAESERNKFEIDKDRLNVEADNEKLRQGAESEKLRLETEKIKAQLELEEKRNKRETIRAYIIAGFSGLVTLGTFVGTWIFNARSQVTSEYFEENGHAHTSRFNRFQLKEPNHPSVKM